MDSTLTVQDIEDEIGDLVPAGMTTLQAVNQVGNRLVYSGKYKGSMVATVFPVVQNFITLPPRYLSVLAGTFDQFPVPTLSNWFSYMEIGPCDLDIATQWGGRIQDVQDGFATQFPIVQPGSVRLYSTASDNGAVVRIYGEQEETEQPVVDPNGVEGENMTLAAPFQQSLYHYSDLTGVQKPATKGPIYVRILPMGGGAEYEIGQWQSWETRPSYRRYTIGPSVKTVRVLCQRRFIKAVAMTDWVWPGNLAAYQFGLQALQYEKTGYEDSAASNWNQALKWLNDEARALRGGAQVPVPMLAWGAGGAIPISN